jgi:tetratricopeptide (TPR) repeat protein
MTEYDQKNQRVETQFNVNIQGIQSPDPNVLLNHGIQLLEAKSYQQSIYFLREVIRVNPSLATAYYYLALALLNGKRPKIIQQRSQFQEIDQLLCTATVMGDFDGTVQWFRVLLRRDYYGGNRMSCPPPSVSEIISSIKPNTTSLNRLQMLLIKLPMSDDQLYSELTKQAFLLEKF